jgi:hypothetical protein
VLQALADTGFRAGLAACCPRLAQLAAPALLEAYRAETRLAEMTHNFDVNLEGWDKARSHCRFVLLPLIHFIPESLTYSVPLFLKRQCDRTLGWDNQGGGNFLGDPNLGVYSANWTNHFYNLWSVAARRLKGVVLWPREIRSKL